MIRFPQGTAMLRTGLDTSPPKRMKDGISRSHLSGILSALLIFLTFASGCAQRSTIEEMDSLQFQHLANRVCITTRHVVATTDRICGRLLLHGEWSKVTGYRDHWEGVWSRFATYAADLGSLIGDSVAGEPSLAVLMVNQRDSVLLMAFNSGIGDSSGNDRMYSYGSPHMIETTLVLRDGQAVGPWHFAGNPAIIRGVISVRLELKLPD